MHHASDVRRARALLGLLVALSTLPLCAATCREHTTVDRTALASLKGAGGYLEGTPVGLDTPVVVNARDFIYATAFDPRDHTLGYVHFVTTNMELSLVELDEADQVAAKRFQVPINLTEFDVEDLAFVPQSGVVIVPSRQGTARAFDERTGALAHEYAAGVPLLRVAVSPSGALVAIGQSDGRVLLLDPASFALLGNSKIHDDEVQGLRFLDDTTLVSASFDGTLKKSAVVPASDAQVRLSSTALRTGERAFLAHLDGARAISSTRDARQPSTTVSSAAVKRLKLKPVTGAELPFVTAAGPGKGQAVELGSVHLGTLELGALQAAVCDACIPPGAELVLGTDAGARATFTDDIATDSIVVTPAVGVENSARLIDAAKALEVKKTVVLPGPATDLDVSRNGKVAVSFSKDKAQRSFELYQAEKAGQYPEPSKLSGATFVDVDAERIGDAFVTHRGYTTTVAVSPDGRTLVTGGWDKRVVVFDAETRQPVTERGVAWLVRRLRFSPDGHLLAVAAWTPVNAFNAESEPALLLYPVALEAVAARKPAAVR